MNHKRIHGLRSMAGLFCGVSAAAVVALAMPGLSFAQNTAQDATTGAPAGNSNLGQLEEVTITATKRSTTVQDTPISITAVTGEDLLDRGIGNFTALAQEVPGISMKNNGPGQTEYAMRGLSANGGNSPTVGFYLDDVPMSPPSLGFVGKTVVDPNLYDLNRIEVLRGPQGTLYGAGSMGGTIKLITNQPDPTGYRASGETILSGTDGGGFNHTENGMVNIPLIANQLAMRAVVSESGISGWIDRIVLNPFPLETNNGANRGNILAAPVQADYKDVNSTEEHSGRVSALYKPNERLTVDAMLFAQHISQDGQSNYDSNPGTLAHYQPFNIPEPYTDNFTMWSVNANYKFDSFDVTSVTSHWERHSATTQDGSETAYSPTFLGLPSFYPAQGGIGPVPITENDRTRQLSEELRAASSGDGRLQWLVGLFYSKFDSDLDYYSFASGSVTLFGTNNFFTDFQPSSIRQDAAFGELTYGILHGLKATVGLRYFTYDSTVTSTDSGVLYTGSAAASPTIGTSGKDHGIDPKFNLSYEVNKELMVYATAERGFRPGGGNQPVPTSGPSGPSCLADLAELGKTSAPESFKPDTLWSYELGEKYRVGRAVTLDAAIYHERWEGVQQQVELRCGFPYFDNLGTVVVNGGELEANAFLTNRWEVAGNFGYSHAYFTESNPTTGTVAGQGVQDIPLMTANGALTYLVPIAADWQGSIRASYDWTDRLYEPPILVPTGDHMLPSHGFANLRGTVFNDRWTVAVFVNNLTNKRAEIEVNPTISAPIPAYYRITTNQPLTAGIDVNVTF